MRGEFAKGSARLSRRAFLGKGGLLLGGAGLLVGLATGDLAGAAQAPPRPAPKSVDLLPWERLRQTVSGGLLRPGEAGYANTAAPWNLRYADRLPPGIALCRSPEDAMAAFSWAERVELAVTVRGGGYSPGGYSSTRGLQLDLKGIDSLGYDPQSRLLTVGGGVRFSQLREVLEPYGRAVPLPRLTDLGLAGTALGGGLTLDMRSRGLLCDQLEEVELVTPRGELKTCNRQSHYDLFWAARGGGAGQLGALTRLVLKTFEAPDLTVFRVAWEGELEDLLPTLLALLPEGSESFGAELNLTARHDRPAHLELCGQFSGEDSSHLLEAILELASPSQQAVERLPFWSAKEWLAQQAPRTSLAERTRYAYSDIAVLACDEVLSSMRAWPGTSGQARWSVRLLGKNVDSVGRRNTAYVHRGARFLTSTAVTWGRNDSASRVEASLAWLNRFHDAMERYTSRESSQNWPDPALDDDGAAYYGENLSFLTSQQSQADPERLLRF